MATAQEALAALNSDIEQATNPMDVFALRAIMHDISIFAYPPTSGNAVTLRQLIADFDSGNAANSEAAKAMEMGWAEAAKETIEAIRNKYAADLIDPKEKGVAEVFFRQFTEHRGDGIAIVTHNAAVSPGTGRTLEIRRALDDVMGFQQLDDFVSALDRVAVIGGEEGYQTKGFSYDPLKKELRDIRQIASDAKEAQAGASFAQIVPRDAMTKIRGKLQRVFSIMDTDEAIPKGFGGSFIQALTIQRAVGPKDPQENKEEIKEITSIKDMRANVDDIVNTYDRLADEGSKLFGDSSQYKEMMRAALAVKKLAEDMDYSDLGKVRQMAEALDTLHAKADTYAKKEAYKEKKTDRGISRKNGSLALLELSDFRKNRAIGVRESAAEVKDLRHYDTVSGEVTKTATSYGDLLKEEIKSNRSYHKRKHDKEMQEAIDRVSKR